MQEKATKVLYVMDYYISTAGGTEGQLFTLVKGLDRKIFEPHLIVFRPTPFVKDNGFPCPVKVLDFEKLRGPRSFLKLLQLGRSIRNEGFKIVNTYFNGAAIYAPLFCKIAGAKVITSRRDMGFWYTPRRLAALKISNLFVDRIVSNSRAVKENVKKREGFSEKKIVVIYNGHDEERYKLPMAVGFRESNNIGKDDPIIGMVANLIHPLKRQYDLIKAFAIVYEKYPNAHLVFAGEGKEKNSLKELARFLNIEKSVHFLGSVPEVIPIIKNFSVCVLCSESEGFSNAIIEYMGCSKPIVCTNVGGNPELIQDGYNGFLVKVGDINSLAERIIRTLCDPSLAFELGKNARMSFVQNLTKDKMLGSYMRLYQELINWKCE